MLWELIWLAHRRKMIQWLGSNRTEGRDVRVGNGGRSSAEMASDSVSIPCKSRIFGGSPVRLFTALLSIIS